MSINLILDAWLPIRRLSGERAWIRPADITSAFADDPILALDFPRPDWNAAVTELLIGLLACVIAPEGDGEWAELWASPPSPEQLADHLAPLAFAFNLDSEGPRCFQDFDAPDKGWKQRPIEWLVLAGPVENTVKLNSDLFSKRQRITALGAPYAAAALVTQQTFAPEGGPGFRTSIRGGGPLTTLATLRNLKRNSTAATLWKLVWASVPGEEWADSSELRDLAEGDAAWRRIFPWLSHTRISANDKPTTPEDAHLLQAFFGLPCRIRLVTEDPGVAKCSLGSPSHFGTVRSWWTRNHGTMYVGWRHPLSPYQSKENAVTAIHPRPGIAAYRNWLDWNALQDSSKKEPSRSIRAWGGRLNKLLALRGGESFDSGEAWQSEVLAYGYDFKQNKARAWMEIRIPYFDPPPGEDNARWSKLFFDTVRQLVAGAAEAGSTLRYRVRLAKFGSCDRENGAYSLPKTSPGKDAFEDLYETFWRETEADFRAALDELRATPADESMTVREAFLGALRSKALRLFDEIAGTDNLGDQDARRIVEARSGLTYAFGETGSVRNALGIVTAEAQAKATKRRNTKKKEPA